MLPTSCRFVVSFLLAALSTVCLGQSPRGLMVFQSSQATALRLAKSTGLPVMAIIAEKGKLPKPLSSRQVIDRSRLFFNVVLPPAGPEAKKLEGAAAGGIVFLDASGTALGQVESGFTSSQLLEKMDRVLDESRSRALDTLKKEPRAGQRAAIDSYVRLGASIPDLVGLLAHKNPEVASAVKKVLTARKFSGVDWALLNAMASPDADLRTACHPLAVAFTRAKNVPAAKFWKEASEEERRAALDKWRESVFGPVPPINKSILDFAFDRFGKQVNDGECAMLVVDAFKAARAQPVRDEGKTYIWGKPLKANETGQVGDVVQFEDARFSNGGFAPHHTQIISRVYGPGRYEVLEQNVNGRRTVGIGQLNLKLRKSGTVVIYRPQPLDEEKK
jgi:hypothetical protein